MEINPTLLSTYVSIARDLVVTVAAVITACIAIYGLRVWKRDLVGKESYEAAKALVYQSHAVSRASDKMRFPIREHERVVFTKEEIENTTEGERWRISEAAAFRNRINEYSESFAEFYKALLSFRVISGSKVYYAFLPFHRALEKPLDQVNLYIALLDDLSFPISVDSIEAASLRGFIYSFGEDMDDYSLAVAEGREKGELFLLPHLHRKSISN